MFDQTCLPSGKVNVSNSPSAVPSWRAASFGFAPPLAYAVTAIVLAILVSAFILLKAWSPSD